MKAVRVDELQRGDVIFDGGKRITVLTVDRCPERCRGYVHVNDALCWYTGSLVTVDSRGE